MRQPTSTNPQPPLYSQPPLENPYSGTHPHPMQMHATNFALIFINLGALILSIPVIVVGLWLATRHHTDCLGNLEWPLILIGIVMMVVSLIGLVGAWRRRAMLLWVYLCLLTFIMLVLLAYIIFAFLVTRGSKGLIITVQGANMKEYVLGDYSPWMRNTVSDARTWDKIKSCLRKDRVCSNLDSKYPTQNIMFHSKLFYIESGCCKPPTACGFTFVNATNWVNPTTPGVNADCSRWNNEPQQLCYNCDSCKAAVIRAIDRDWRKAAKVALAVLVALVLLYALAWLAFLQALADKTVYSAARTSRI